MSWYLKVLKNYAVFKGRARRKEYWMYTLFFIIFCIVASVLDNIIGSVWVITLLFYLASLVPSLAVAVRRLHDTGKSGWWIFISFIPLIGGIWLLVLLVTDSNPAENSYGPNPKTA